MLIDTVILTFNILHHNAHLFLIHIFIIYVNLNYHLLRI
jgi:hypothetical protein